MMVSNLIKTSSKYSAPIPVIKTLKFATLLKIAIMLEWMKEEMKVDGRKYELSRGDELLYI